MKIYTQTGDRGKTSLLSGERVSKAHVRINAYGEVDELNSVIGALIASLDSADYPVRAPLLQIQSDLFVVGGWLSATPGSEYVARLKVVGKAHSQRLESLIDAMDAELPELKDFILPGGCISAAWAHMARTVCRRSERAVIALADAQDEPAVGAEGLQMIITFLNRLSDYFFILSRYLNHRASVDDIIWQE